MDFLSGELEIKEGDIKDVKDLKKFYKKRIQYINNKKICEIIKINEETGEVEERLGGVYLATHGYRTKQFFVYSKIDSVSEGNTTTSLKRIPVDEIEELLKDWSVTSDDFLFNFLNEKKIKQEVNETYAKEKKRRQEEGLGLDITKKDVIIWVLSHKYLWFTEEQSFSFDVVSRCSKELIEQGIKSYLTSVYQVDPRLITIMKGGLVEFPSPITNSQLAKYRGHALLIKNTKAGVSSISKRIGENIDNTSFASLEGFADADGNIYYSALHNTSQHINFDEFLMMKDVILQKIFNYLEIGQYTSRKATRKIENKGNARIIFTANPSDVEFSTEQLKRSEDIQIVGGAFTEVEQENIPYKIFMKSILKLTGIIDASFSRLAVVMLTADLIQAKKIKEETEEDRVLMELGKSTLRYLQPIFLGVYQNSLDYLNRKIAGYENYLDEVIKITKDVAVKQTARGQKEAYRHIRGLALANSLVEHAYYLLHLNKDITKETAYEVYNSIYEKAEEELEDILKINMNTFNLLCSVSEEAVKLNERILRGKYTYVDVFFKVLDVLEQEGKEVNIDNLRVEHKKLVEAKEISGKYARWNELYNKLKSERNLRNFKIAGLYNKVHVLL